MMSPEEILRQSIEALREMIGHSSRAPWTDEPHANGLDRLIRAANGQYVAQVYSRADAQVITDMRNNILRLMGHLEKLVDLVDAQYRKLEQIGEQNAYLRRHAGGQTMENWSRFKQVQQERDAARGLSRYTGIGLAAILSALDNEAIEPEERISRARQYVSLMSIHLDTNQ